MKSSISCSEIFLLFKFFTGNILDLIVRKQNYISLTLFQLNLRKTANKKTKKEFHSIPDDLESFKEPFSFQRELLCP